MKQLFRKIGIAILASWGLFINAVTAQQPAFPGAEGAGMYATGGRGTTAQPTTVFEVTSLDDTNTPGTFRYAVSASQATYPYRTIVFRVSGTIHLTSRLSIRSNTTVAGQTAPGDGICFADYPVVLGGDNIVLRYVRCRMGDKNQLATSPAGCGVPVAPFTSACTPVDGSGGDDALGSLGGKNLIIDHCSVSWSSDEALTVYRGDSVTMQWNFVEEPLNYSYHFESGDADFEQHGYGGIWGSKHGSFHHNLIAHARNRLPRWAGSSTYANLEGELCDFNNNILYNWGINNVYGGEGGKYNLVNNYYKYGPNTGANVRYRIVGVDSNATSGYAMYYLNGNYVDGSTANTNNNWSGAAMNTGNAADTVKSKLYDRASNGFAPPTTQSATDAYDLVLNGAGATLPRRDTLDRRIVNDVRFRVGRFIDVQGGYPHGTPYAQTVNAWPALNSLAAPTDTDHDGMPDSYETANGLNPNDAADRQTVAANSYTNLENYLNGISNTTPELTFTGVLNAFSQTGGTPSPAQSVSVSGVNLTGNVTITAPAGYQISTNGTTWVSSGSNIVLTPTAGTTSGVTLYIRLNATSAGTYSGNTTAVTPNQTNFYIPVTGNTVATTNGPATATWTLQTTPDPTVTGAVTATSQTLGSALAGVLYGYTAPSGTTNWQRVGTTSNIPSPYNENSYVEYTITPAAGKSLNVTSFSMWALGGGTGSERSIIRYSTDGFTTSNTVGNVTYNNTSYANTVASPIVFLNSSTNPLTNNQQVATANTNIQVDAGSTLSIRVYVWLTSTSGTIRNFTTQQAIISGTISDIILPLKLTNFGASLQNRQVQLFWNTIDEKGLSKYEIQSAGSDMQFATIGSVIAKNGGGKNNYEFPDPQALTATRYYRLKMLDRDGSFTYSKTVVLNPKTEGSLSVFPNPASTNVMVTYPRMNNTSILQLVAADGRLLQTINLPVGSTQISVDVRPLVTGNYYFKLGNSQQAVPFVRQ